MELPFFQSLSQTFQLFPRLRQELPGRPQMQW
jgi:hypothetical protein